MRVVRILTLVAGACLIAMQATNAGVMVLSVAAFMAIVHAVMHMENDSHPRRTPDAAAHIEAVWCAERALKDAREALASLAQLTTEDPPLRSALAEYADEIARLEHWAHDHPEAIMHRLSKWHDEIARSNEGRLV